MRRSPPITSIKIDKISPYQLKKLKNIIQNRHPFPLLIYNVPYCLFPKVPHWIVAEYDDGDKTEQCQRCAWNLLCPGFPFDRVRSTTPTPIEDKPNEVVIEICGKCQLSCEFCRFSNSSTVIIETSQIFSIIDEAHMMGVSTIRLTGGEPLLHPEIDIIVGYIEEKGMNCIVNTNGLSRRIVELAKRHNNLQNVLVSIQYKDLFNKKLIIQKLNNLALLKAHTAIVRIGTVIPQRVNYRQFVFRMAKVIYKLPVFLWELYRPFSPECRPITIDRQGWESITKGITELKKRGFPHKLGIANSVPFCYMDELSKLLLGNFTDDGHTRIVFSAQYEEFIPSYFSNLLLGKSLMKAWDNPVLRARRNLGCLPKQCDSCTLRNICRGGSYSMWPQEDPMIPKNTSF